MWENIVFSGEVTQDMSNAEGLVSASDDWLARLTNWLGAVGGVVESRTWQVRNSWVSGDVVSRPCENNHAFLEMLST